MAKKKRKALAVIVWEKGKQQKVLLLHRPKSKKMDAYWQSVTGGAEKDEELDVTAIREAQEETGLEFSEHPHYLGLHYEFEGQWGPAEEKAYRIRVRPTARPPNPYIDPSEHDGFRWCSVKTALKLVKFPSNREAIFRAVYRQAAFQIDKNGDWFQEGEQITHKRTLALLQKNLKQKEAQEFFVALDNIEVAVEVEDAPLFVQSIDLEKQELYLSNGETIKFAPKTCFINQENVLYCMHENWKVKFLRPAYYEISKFIESEANNYFIVINEKRYKISMEEKS